MHILFISDNFPPESNAPASRTYEHSKEWVKYGHKVTIITCSPNFPEGRIFPGYSNEWLKKEIMDGINVHRVKTYVAPNSGFFRRILDFISFMIASFFHGLFIPKVDLVIGTSPQFFTVISAWALSKIKKIPFIFELRDIWPASITAVGAMKNNFLIKILERIEIFLYHQAKLIISVTHSFKKDLIKRGISAEKIKVVLNGVDLKKFNFTFSKDLFLKEKYNLKGKFVAGYVGTHGQAHALESIIKAAQILQNEESIKILLVGTGSEKPKIEKLAQDLDLHNLLMLPMQPREAMEEILSLCDVSIVSLRDVPLFKTVIPSKIFESMAMKLPIIISVPDGEATKIINDTKSGLVVRPESPKDLAESLKILKNNEVLYAKLASNSLKASKEFNRQSLALKMLEYLELSDLSK